MYTCPIQIKDVRYNAASQSFEAAVTIHDNATVRTYACDFSAPMTLSFEDAAKGLSKQAVRRHQHRGGLFSRLDQKGMRTSKPHRKFDPVRWLEEAFQFADKKAA
ncbi:Orotidine 5'-phosphate decarboxylase [Sulfitobacter noctilucicola]|uniref:Uncharacterized protein n=2 Tax=Sulfitobacter noctilucicola TaxID=1342301 RepID=A0A7W6M4G6_9RHOB|nr:Orotidine 5'-phosphate decarboxylase [Sulfitobacter noctilucicola]MBB4172245.1 hypothetical protein [Sulfitobacter noctilucicola]